MKIKDIIQGLNEEEREVMKKFTAHKMTFEQLLKITKLSKEKLNKIIDKLELLKIIEELR